MAVTNIGFNKRAGAYVNLENGRFIPRDLVMGELNGDVARYRTKAAQLAERLANGEISNAKFSSELRDLLKPMLTRSSALGAGGMAELQGSQLGTLGAGTRAAYGSLRYLTQQISRGELTPAQIRERAGRIGNHAYAHFHRAEQLSRAQGGFSLGWRRLDPGSKHCPDCPTYATDGWVSISEIVPVGDGCVCNGRCRCAISYRKATPEELFMMGLGGGEGLEEAVLASQAKNRESARMVPEFAGAPPLFAPVG